MWRDAAVMLAAGMGVPLLAALNAQLGVRIGSPAIAACVLFAVGFAVCAGVAVLTAGGGPLARLAAQPPFFLSGGVLMAFYLLSITWIAPRFGLGNAILCVLMGQMVSAAIIDHWGLLSGLPRPISAVRATGLLVMAAGLTLSLRG